MKTYLFCTHHEHILVRTNNYTPYGLKPTPTLENQDQDQDQDQEQEQEQIKNKKFFTCNTQNEHTSNLKCMGHSCNNQQLNLVIILP